MSYHWCPSLACSGCQDTGCTLTREALGHYLSSGSIPLGMFPILASLSLECFCTGIADHWLLSLANIWEHSVLGIFSWYGGYSSKIYLLWLAKWILWVMNLNFHYLLMSLRQRRSGADSGAKTRCASSLAWKASSSLSCEGFSASRTSCFVLWDVMTESSQSRVGSFLCVGKLQIARHRRKPQASGNWEGSSRQITLSPWKVLITPPRNCCTQDLCFLRRILKEGDISGEPARCFK